MTTTKQNETPSYMSDVRLTTLFLRVGLVLLIIGAGVLTLLLLSAYGPLFRDQLLLTALLSALLLYPGWFSLMSYKIMKDCQSRASGPA